MTTLETRPATAPPTGTPYDQLTVVPAGIPAAGSPPPSSRCCWRWW
jgi:hypothetical protein